MKEQKIHGNFYYFSLSFVISTIIQTAIIMSAVFLLFGNRTQSVDMTSDPKVSNAQSNVIISQSATVLFGTSLSDESPDLFALMSLDTSDRVINIALLPKDLALADQTAGDILGNWQQKYGALSTKEAVSSALGIAVDKIINVSKSKFADMLTYLTPPHIELSNPLSITDAASGLNFQLEAGGHDLNTAVFLNMMATLMAKDKVDMLSNAFGAIVAQRGSRIFNDDKNSFYDAYLSTATTDIDAENYQSAATPLKIIFSMDGSRVRTFQFSFVPVQGGVALSPISGQDMKRYF